MSSPPSQTPEELDDEWSYHNCMSCNRRMPIETDENYPDLVCRECRNEFTETVTSDAYLQAEYFLSELFRNFRSFSLPDHGATAPPSLDPQSEVDLFGSELNRSDEEDDGESEEIEGENDDSANHSEMDFEAPPSLDPENQENNGEDYMVVEVPFFLTGMRREFPRAIYISVETPFGNLYFSNQDADYTGDDGFDDVLDRLAEADNGKKGAPPAAKSVVSGLPTFKILTEADATGCAICQDVVGVGELMKKLPCGHGYHGDCILTWLDSRNSCPVCRLELPTDDVEYEEQRKNRERTQV